MIESEFIATVLASKYFSIIQMYVYSVSAWVMVVITYCLLPMYLCCTPDIHCTYNYSIYLIYMYIVYFKVRQCGKQQVYTSDLFMRVKLRSHKCVLHKFFIVPYVTMHNVLEFIKRPILTKLHKFVTHIKMSHYSI